MKIDADKAKELLFPMPDELRDIIMEKTIFHENNNERFELFVEQGLTYIQEEKVYDFIYKTIDERILYYGISNAACSIAEAEKFIADEFDIDTAEYQKSPYFSYGWNGYSIANINGKIYFDIRPTVISY